MRQGRTSASSGRAPRAWDRRSTAPCSLGSRTPAGKVLGDLAYLVALFLIEPLYVASDFTLYLNRRTELEGWDIEIAFRQLAARRASAREAA